MSAEIDSLSQINKKQTSTIYDLSERIETNYRDSLKSSVYDERIRELEKVIIDYQNNNSELKKIVDIQKADYSTLVET